jgi:hypothetical protein
MIRSAAPERSQVAKAAADIRSLARSHTATAVRILVGIMKESRSPPAARVSAAIAILDRGWGKPTQSVEMDLRRRNEPCPNLKELSDAELLALIQACHDAGAPQVLDRPLTLEEWEALDCKPQVAGLIDARPQQKV